MSTLMFLIRSINLVQSIILIIINMPHHLFLLINPLVIIIESAWFIFRQQWLLHYGLFLYWWTVQLLHITFIAINVFVILKSVNLQCHWIWHSWGDSHTFLLNIIQFWIIWLRQVVTINLKYANCSLWSLRVQTFYILRCSFIIHIQFYLYVFSLFSLFL